MFALSAPLFSPFLDLFAARSLAGLGRALAALPARALLPGHCLTVVSWYAGAEHAALAANFMASFWVRRCGEKRGQVVLASIHRSIPQTPSPSHIPLHPKIGLLAAFGGGILTALLLQDPAGSPIGLLADNAVGVAYTLAWWGLLYAPAPVRSALRALVTFPPTRAAARACMNILRASLVVARVDTAVRRFPGVVAAPLLLGTLAGCGGKVLTDAAFLSSSPSIPRRPAPFRTEFAVPGLALRSAAGGAALYWGAVHVAGCATPSEGLALVTLLFAGHGLTQDALAAAAGPGGGRPLDYTAAPAAALHWVAGVPVPGSGGAGNAGRPQRAAARAKKRV